MSERSMRIRLESATLFRHLAFFLPGGLTWLRFSTCTFLRHLAFWNRTEALQAFRLFLSILLSSLSCMSCLTPALHGLGMVIYSILDLSESDS